jgi:LacI family transcriptional regulator
MATIRDVAKLAGVGIGTVSRVISGNGSVSNKTLSKVNDAMAALKFIPNTSAQSLSSKRYNTIGLWGTKSSGEMSRATLTKIERELQPFDVSLITTMERGTLSIILMHLDYQLTSLSTKAVMV